MKTARINTVSRAKQQQSERIFKKLNNETLHVQNLS